MFEVTSRWLRVSNDLNLNVIAMELIDKTTMKQKAIFCDIYVHFSEWFNFFIIWTFGT